MEDRYLVAFPHQVWHRTIAKRVLPQNMLIKPTAVEVAYAGSASLSGRVAHLEDAIGKMAENINIVLEKAGATAAN